MGPFEYIEPGTVKEALSSLNKYREKAKVLAGGTDLSVMMKEQKISPQYVISLGGISGLDYLRIEDGQGLKIGAMATIRSLEQSHQLIESRYNVISEAASQLASMSVRNIATVGGNLCNAAPSADTAPALVGLSAKVKLVSVAGERIVPLEDFFTGPGATVLQSNELLIEIQIPATPGHTGGAYLKHATRGLASLAIAGVAVVITLAPGDGVCADARVVLGAVAPTPMRAHKAEAILRGKRIDESAIEKAAQTASGESLPISDVRAPAEYRREMVKVLTTDAIRLASGRARLAA